MKITNTDSRSPFTHGGQRSIKLNNNKLDAIDSIESGGDERADSIEHGVVNTGGAAGL